ncbi:hypothetical protein KUTeg_016305 [Tegillarca granosa]|uniref:Uncharacterized protein n=1 Tax=Tegillarca granosa TaxID=220873 RepID=A0ABQ9EQR3_TEGGR|nr:hypothetical protein KUTeg_016305 [Tegillarca granosa]
MSRIWNYLIFMSIFCSGHATHDGDSDIFKFECHGQDAVAVLKEGISMKDLCGDNFLLSFNNTDGHPLHISLYFSSTDDYDPDSAVQLIDESVGGSYGVLEYDSMKTISMNEIPCGTGFLLATIKDLTTHSVYEDIERAVKECDYSDIDLELVTHTPVTSKIDLYPGMGYINQQLQKHVGYPLHLEVKNHGGKKLRNTTLEGAHMIGFYLRHQNSSTIKHDHCEIPDAVITDSFIDVITFTNSIEAGDMHSFDQHHENAINMTFDHWAPICDHTHGNCTIFPNNVMRGHQIYAVFQSQHGWKSYEQKLSEWQEINLHDPGEMLSLMGMVRQRLGQKMLEHIYTKPDKGLCKWVDQMFEDEDNEDDADTKTTDETPPSDHLMLRIRSRLQSLKTELYTMLIPRDMENDFNDVEKEIKNVGDEMWKHKFHGMSMGLKLSAAYKHSEYHAALSGHFVPDHALRSIFLTPIEGLTKLMHNYDTIPDSMRKTMIAGTVPYIAALDVMVDLLPLPKSAEHRLRRVMRKLKTLIKSNMIKPTDMTTDMPTTMPGFTTTMPKVSTEIRASQFQCPFVVVPELELISPISIDLYYLMYTTPENEHVSDGDKLAHCHSNIMAAYMQYGGDRMQSKDIVKAFLKMKVYNDRIMEGTVSPWTGKMFWKTAAFCHCDKCHRSTAGGNHDTMNATTDHGGHTHTDPYSSMHHTTTDPYMG